MLADWNSRVQRGSSLLSSWASLVSFVDRFQRRTTRQEVAMNALWLVNRGLMYQAPRRSPLRWRVKLAACDSMSMRPR